MNVDVASLHANPVSETVYYARRQQELFRRANATIPTGGVSAATWSERFVWKLEKSEAPGGEIPSKRPVL